MTRPVYFWESYVTPHKLPLFRALAARPEIGPAVYISQAGLPEARAAQGWDAGSTEGVDLRLTPSPAEVDRILREAPVDAVHFFSETHWVPAITHGIAAAVRHRRRIIIAKEPRVREGWKGKLRLLHSLATEHRIRRHAAAVLAIGRNGPLWFRLSGYRPARIFPFAYFLPAAPATFPDPAAPLRIGYLGRLIEAKGIRLFLDAVERLSLPCEIGIAGAGEEAGRVEAAARANPAMTYLGILPMAEVQAFLAGIDILIMPSTTTDDGWGAVVSEALIAGAAVVATSQVGASICLDEAWRGAVVDSLDPADLARAIERVGADLPALRAGREARARWGDQHLSAEAGAAYVTAILAHLYDAAPRPRPFYSGEGWI